MRKLLMFDFDGVIADSLDFSAEAFLTVCADEGCGQLRSKAQFLGLFEGNLYEGLAALGIAGELVGRIQARLAAWEDEAMRRCRPYEGIVAALAALAAKHRLVVVSSNRTRMVKRFLEHYRVAGVGEVVGGDQEQSKKAKLMELAGRHSGGEAWYVGDTVGDMLEGKAAEVLTAGAAWGWHGRAKLATVSPTCLLDSPDELPKRLG